jgi:hypothetical protein
MGEFAGKNMAFHAGRGQPIAYEHLPYFYSDMFDLGYEAVGMLDSRLETLSDWQDEFRKGVVYYLKEGNVRGVLLWNLWEQVDLARKLIGKPWAAEFDARKEYELNLATSERGLS